MRTVIGIVAKPAPDYRVLECNDGGEVVYAVQRWADIVTDVRRHHEWQDIVTEATLVAAREQVADWVLLHSALMQVPELPSKQ